MDNVAMKDLSFEPVNGVEWIVWRGARIGTVEWNTAILSYVFRANGTIEVFEANTLQQLARVCRVLTGLRKLHAGQPAAYSVEGA